MEAATVEPQVIFSIADVANGLLAEVYPVKKRLGYEFAVRLKDTDADQVVGIKTFPTSDRAIVYAKKLVA